MKKFAVIDGSGFMFRARYAFPPMPNAEGRNLNVVYGFARMMLKLIDEGWDYFVICRDSPVKTKRHEAYPDYKAQRKKLEDDFKVQIPLVHELIVDMRIPNILAPGYEADDIIATLVRQYQEESDLSIQIFSSDKDLKQLLQPNVLVVDPLKNTQTTTRDFELEFGFPPASIVDYLALIGDSADNVKGVAGIGPKNASELIQTYHSIEEIYDHLSHLTPKLRDKLESGREDAFFSKQLIQLLQVPELANYPLANCRLQLPYEQRSQVLFEKWQFKSLKKFFEEFRKRHSIPQQLGLF